MERVREKKKENGNKRGENKDKDEKIIKEGQRKAKKEREINIVYSKKWKYFNRGSSKNRNMRFGGRIIIWRDHYGMIRKWEKRADWGNKNDDFIFK